MAWSIGGVAVTANDLKGKEKGVPAHLARSTGAGASEVEHVDAAWNAARGIIDSGALGKAPHGYVVTLAGHSNPDASMAEIHVGVALRTSAGVPQAAAVESE